MHLRAILTAGVLVSTVTASVLNLNIYTDSDGGAHDQAVLTKTEEVTADDKPAWKKRDELHLVPLVPEARTGVLPIELEEALLFARKFHTPILLTHSLNFPLSGSSLRQ